MVVVAVGWAAVNLPAVDLVDLDAINLVDLVVIDLVYLPAVDQPAMVLEDPVPVGQAVIEWIACREFGVSHNLIGAGSVPERQLLS